MAYFILEAIFTRSVPIIAYFNIIYYYQYVIIYKERGNCAEMTNNVNFFDPKMSIRTTGAGLNFGQ